MPASLPGTAVVPGSVAGSVVATTQVGTYPAIDTYPGSDVYPGRGNDIPSSATSVASIPGTVVS